MIAGALVLPVPARRLGTEPRATLVRVVAVVVLMGAIAGALAWFTLLSPFSLRRWELDDSTQILTVDQPTTYVVYEEGPGASTTVSPPLINVGVRSISNRRIATTNLVDDQGHSAVTYKTPWHEGRALVSFTIDKPGKYSVLTFPSAAAANTNAAGGGPSGSGAVLLDFAKLPKVALAPAGTPNVWGGIWGFVLLVVVPSLAGILLLAYAGQRWPSPARQPGAGWRERRRARRRLRSGSAGDPGGRGPLTPNRAGSPPGAGALASVATAPRP